MITVLGASGFIGSHLVAHLRDLGADCFAPSRDQKLTGRKLGHLIYCIGLTADFRSRPFETVSAHVCKLAEVLQECDFESLLYLSSTRVYLDRPGPACEEDPLSLSPQRPTELYNASKLMGESLSLNCGRPTRVVRLSNVYGGDFASENFLSAIIRNAIHNGKITLQTSLDTERDYVSISDVVELLPKIATVGGHRIYNLASGMSVSNRELTSTISQLTGCQVEVVAGASKVSFPRTNIGRIKEEFSFQPANVLNDMAQLVELYRVP